MKRSTFALIAILALGFAQPAVGQAQVKFKFKSGGPVASNGVRVGPYQAQALSLPGQPVMDIYCVDFLHGIRGGTVWDANMSQMSGDLSNTRFGNAFRSRYQKAAWLSMQFSNTDEAEWGGLHSAIWNIMTPGHPGWGAGEQSYWFGLAEANYESVDLSQWSVVTDVRAIGMQGGVQEFITPNVVTPEPITLTLLGSGLLGIGAMRRRRRMSGLR